MSDKVQKKLDLRIEGVKNIYNAKKAEFDKKDNSIGGDIKEIYKADTAISKMDSDVTAAQEELDTMLTAVEDKLGMNGKVTEGEMSSSTKNALEAALARFSKMSSKQKSTNVGDTKETLGGKMEDLLGKTRMMASSGRDPKEFVAAMNANMDMVEKMNEGELAKKEQYMVSTALDLIDKRFNGLTDDQKTAFVGDTKTRLGAKLKELSGKVKLMVKRGRNPKELLKAMSANIDMVEKMNERATPFNEDTAIAAKTAIAEIMKQFTSLSARQQNSTVGNMSLNDKLEDLSSLVKTRLLSKEDPAAIIKQMKKHVADAIKSDKKRDNISEAITEGSLSATIDLSFLK